MAVALSREKPLATWRRSPQRVWLRRAVFQIHLWLGVLLALYAVVIGLSGSALVFSQEIAAALDRSALRVPAQPATQTLDRSVRNITAARPHWHPIGLEDFDRTDQAFSLLLSPDGQRTSNYRLVSFNPNTGAVLLDRRRYAGFLGWMTNLHFYLLAGSSGLKVSGFLALGLLVLCASGLLLWWPGVRRWASALLLHRRATWQRFNWDLHSVVGFWSSAALIILTVTGLYFAFPEPFAKLLIFATGGVETVPPPPKPPQASTAPLLNIDQILAAARQALPPNAPAGYLAFPAHPAAPYSVTGYYTGTAPYSQLVQVSLDPHTGAPLSFVDTRQQILARRIIQYFFAVHFGSFGGPTPLGFAIKLLWVLLGIIPALLAVTGILMYWVRKLRPLWRTMSRTRTPRDIESISTT